VIRNGTRADLAAIGELLGGANDSPYDIRAVAEEKVFGNGFSGPPRVRVFEDGGAMRGVAVSCGKYLRILGVDREYRRRGIGSELLRDSSATVIAAEAGNYFTPGVVERDSATIGFLRMHGFGETAATWNMHVGIGDWRLELGSGNRSQSPISNLQSLLPFVHQHFGPVWAFEASRAVSAFYIPDSGFAVVEANNRGLGTFGPIGVVESMRGHGHGKELLLAALSELRRLGYQRAIIPWTDALDFYRNHCGAEPAHRFLTFTR